MTTPHTPATTEHPRILGSVRVVEGVAVVHVEDVYDTDIEDLWSAVTEPARLARWLVEVDGDLRPTGSVRTRFTSGAEGPGRIDVCERPHHLLVTMAPGAGDETVIEAWLSADGAGTRLVVEERGLPLDEAVAHGSGWQVHIEDLGTYLAGGRPGPWHDRWLELSPTYDQLYRLDR